MLCYILYSSWHLPTTCCRFYFCKTLASRFMLHICSVSVTVHMNFYTNFPRHTKIIKLKKNPNPNANR